MTGRSVNVADGTGSTKTNPLAVPATAAPMPNRMAKSALPAHYTRGVIPVQTMTGSGGTGSMATMTGTSLPERSTNGPDCIQSATDPANSTPIPETEHSPSDAAPSILLRLGAVPLRMNSW